MIRIRMALTLSTVVLFLAGDVHAQTDSGRKHWQLPLKFQVDKQDPVQQQKNFYEFIWQSFIALNWPNEELVIDEKGCICRGERGKPDSNKRLGHKVKPGEFAQTVWENYKELWEVFPESDDWADDVSGVWNSVRAAPPHKPAGARFPLRFNGLTAYATDTNQPYFFPHFTGPLYDRNGNPLVYEVAVNRAFFRYVRFFKYYNAQEQIDAVNKYIAGKRDETAFQRPPFGNPAETCPGGYLHDLPEYAQTGMVDVKAAWRVLEESDDRSRYLHRTMVVGFEKDGCPQVRTVGLVALHILRWTPNGYHVDPKDPSKNVDGAFVASTFEQIDNVQSHGKVPASFNHGNPTPEELEYGFSSGKQPPVIAEGTPFTPNRKLSVNIFRATSQQLPPAVVKVNTKYQSCDPVKDTPFQYYQLIGTQNRHQGAIQFKTAAQREKNGHQGPITGVYTNANNLVNSALESYTQKNFSCILCHIRARPFGVLHTKKEPFPSFPQVAFEDDHFKILTFLLQSAKTRKSSTQK